MFKKFSNWKKNIEPLQWNGLNAYFNLSLDSYEKLWVEICKLLDSFQPFKLNELLQEGKYNHEKNDYVVRKSLEESEFKKKAKLLKESIFLTFVKKSRSSKNERIIFTIEAEYLDRAFIDKIASISGITFAVLFNPYFKYWENNRFKSLYHFQGGLKERYYPTLDSKRLDISDRPGRYTPVDDFNFLGGAEYWISPNLLEEDKINSIQGVEIEFIKSNNINHVKLFDLSDYWEKDSQDKIAKLRSLLEIDKNEK